MSFIGAERGAAGFRAQNRLLLALIAVLSHLPAVLAASGEDFSNNLFSDLAPLLALFGEQVAKQFLSHSTSWLDCLIFACNPISIITGAISAIRVGGSRSMKSIIGRAGEGEASAELELMSSTSSDVCELWNGVGIVRVVGSPAIVELIYRRETNDPATSRPSHLYDNSVCAEVYTLEDAKKTGLFTLKGHSFNTNIRHDSNITSQFSIFGNSANQPLIEHIEDQDNSPPNIFRNVAAQPSSGFETIAVAIIGVILQVGVLVYDAAITYHPRWTMDKNGAPVDVYAFPLTCTGTLATVTGMFICAWVIETRTVEERWEVSRDNKKDPLQIVWLQRGQLVGDQAFGSFAIYAPRNQKMITTSRKSREGLVKLQFWSLWGSITSVIGFILQFVGLRNMHWSASIAQLVATGTMTALRLVIRRHLSTLPDYQALPEGFELDFMTKAITDCKKWRVLTKVSPTRGDQAVVSEVSDFASRVFHTRVRLSALTLWRTETSDIASQVTQCLQAILNHLFDAGSGLTISKTASRAPTFVWTVPIGICRNRDEEFTKLSLTLHRNSTEGKWTPWEVEREELEAVISLWMSHFEKHDFRSVLWVLGPHNIFSNSVYDWWIYRGTPCVRICNLTDICGANQVDSSRILNLSPGPIPASASIENRVMPIDEQLLGTVTKVHLPQMCAQYLVGLFLVHALKIVKDLDGKVDVLPGVGGSSYTLLNENVSRIAEIVQRYGFATVEDSYRLVVPPLSQYHKLKDPFDDPKVLQKILLTYKDQSSPIQDSHSIDYSRLTRFCTEKAKLLAEKDRWGAARDAFGLFLSVSREVLGAQHACTIEARNATKEFAKKFVDDNFDNSKAGTLKNPTVDDGAFLLHTAAANNDLKLVYKLLEDGLGVNAWNAESRTPLSLSIEHGHPNIARLLIFYGAEINFATSTDDIAREYRFGNAAVAKIIVLNWGSMELVHKAAAAGQDEILKTLLAGSGIDVFAKDKTGRTALHHASIHGHETTVGLLVENGADLATTTPEGQTALHIAARNKHPAVVKLLVKAGIDLNDHDNNGETALHIAVIAGIDSVVKELVDNGANVTSENNEKQTALHLAVIHKHQTTIRYLILHGADLAARDEKGLTALHFACRGKETIGDQKTIELLLDNGADMTAKSIWGGTPIDTASESGNEKTVKLLIAKGADANHRDNTGRTPLDNAAKNGHAMVVKCLVDAGVDTENKDGFGRMALHYAAMEGRTDIARFLVSKGLGINVADIDGWTPLHYASNNHHQEIVKILLDGGADASARDRLGRNASYYTGASGKAVYWSRALSSGPE